MSDLKYPQRPVRQICWVCVGTGYHLESVQPMAFRPCWMCYGARGFDA